ncbi:adenylate/guanylate cyclase [Chthoniobacter flavus Ellin428]|uniref:Adenylate/guanylate cyclase n=2 Tax=Chthoniobacter flavus TaxID=191863 RepID=B4D5D5_9BACT|nr:adenylate/guanylate cyclase [Chthoniobacter flavus Ellin428]TCO91363.1 adenylate cyclase [Chthoniobacter flavus]
MLQFSATFRNVQSANPAFNPMGAKLSIQPAQSDAFDVTIGNTATIGRTRENTVCLSFSPLVSRQHAIIRCHNGWQYQLIDLGSRNGTYVNDQRVVMPMTLTDGARIRIADNILIFSEHNDESSGEHNAMTLVGTISSNDHSVVESRPVALLVCDIRGFSTMSEKIPSGDMAQMLGAWFRETGNLVAQSGGTIDKFIGDAMLAYWGAAGRPAADCGTAFAAAKMMMSLADSRKWQNGAPFRIAVALHFGKVTCSNVGVAAERDATIIGDAVNTVFRLEGVSKELNQRVVMSGDFADQMPEVMRKFTDFGEKMLKGKSNPVRVFGMPNGE